MMLNDSLYLQQDLSTITLGIDFGTTFTVVAWQEDNQIRFLEVDGSLSLHENLPVASLNSPFLESTSLLPISSFPTFLQSSEINGRKNLKRILAQGDEKIFEHVCEFFAQLNVQIENKLGVHGIKQCVLTVPARFDDIARNAIKAAAISARFHVLKLLAEPVAAAICALNGKDTPNGYYVVYDLGGGTFDATLLKLHKRVFQILAITGIANFGGFDIDNLLAEEKNLSLGDARRYKEYGNFTIQETSKINRMLEPTYTLLEQMLEENALSRSDINALVLAGGSSSLPMIVQKLSSEYKIAHVDIASDLLVAAGAAIYANNITKGDDNSLLIDAIPFDLGIETLGDQMEILIPKNSPLPAMCNQYFQPVNGAAVLIHVLQGVDCKASEAVSLTKFEIQSLEPFEVSFMLDCDGILSVKIGQQVRVVSAKFGAVNQDLELIMLLEQARIKAVTQEQKQCLKYLEQASTIKLSAQAREWVIQQYKKLF